MTNEQPRAFKSRLIKAGSWSVLGHFSSQFIRLASNIVMTRLLVPEMFGVMAIANVLIFGLAMLSDLGLRQNIIQSAKGNDENFLNTAWTVQIIRGGILGIIGCCIAFALYLANRLGLIVSDNVYADPILPWVIAVLSLSPVINGFESTNLATLNRNINLSRITIIELASQVMGITLMMVLAYFEPTIWALVVGGLFSGLVKMYLSHVAIDGMRNKIHWDPDAFREIFHFGKWMFISSILGFFLNSGDKLLFGGMFSSELLGIYSIAALIAGAVQAVISKLINSVVFPALGEVQRLQPERVKELYYKIRFPIDAFSLLVSGLLFMSGETIINLLYDDRYAQAGIMLEILGLSLVVMRFGVAGQFYLVKGKPQIMSVLIAFRLLFMFTFIPIGFWMNQHIGAIWAYTIAMFPGLFITFYYKYKFEILDAKKEIMILPFFAIGLMFGWLWNTAYFTWLEVMFH